MYIRCIHFSSIGYRVDRELYQAKDYGILLKGLYLKKEMIKAGKIDMRRYT